jgi:hypothetical protein
LLGSLQYHLLTDLAGSLDVLADCIIVSHEHETYEDYLEYVRAGQENYPGKFNPIIHTSAQYEQGQQLIKRGVTPERVNRLIEKISALCEVVR